MDKQELKNAVSSIVDGLEREAALRAAPAVREICDRYPDIRDMEAFHALIGYQLDEVKMRTMLAKMEIKNPRHRDACYQWETIYRAVGNLVEDLRARQGKEHPYACCFDVGRFVANSYLRYCVDGVLPDLTTVSEGCYWKPEFGTGQEWMDLCDGIVAMSHGKLLVLQEKLKAFEKYGEKQEERG